MFHGQDTQDAKKHFVKKKKKSATRNSDRNRRRNKLDPSHFLKLPVSPTNVGVRMTCMTVSTRRGGAGGRARCA